MMMCSILFVSCTKEESPKEKAIDMLEGSWVITSYIEDGDDYLDDFFMELEFKEYKTNNGRFKWSFYDGYEVGLLTGKYDCNSDGDELELIIEELDSEIVEFDMDLDEDELSLRGTIDGYQIRIKAEK